MLIQEEKKYIMSAYTRYPLTIITGVGCHAYASDGNWYLDMVGGIACCPLGHQHPAVKDAILSQVNKLTNVSNLFYTEEQIELAKKLVSLSGLKKCFFSNSGTEANEAAIKLAIASTKKHEFVVCQNSFHGRTFGSLSATYGKNYTQKFSPLLSKFDFVPYGDLSAISNAINEKTAAILLEPIQGEAGIILPHHDYLKELSELCESKGVLFMLDEVQTGNGRTGTYFEYLSHGIKPDIVTTAKGLANGLPIGVTLSNGVDFEPGDHASTFGGNSFVCAVASSVVSTISKNGMMENAAVQGDYIKNQILKFDKKEVKEVRGKGLMIGIELDKPAKEKISKFMKHGVLVNVVNENTIRLLPPLILVQKQADQFLSAFNEVVS
ncbi:MAG: acetylornithine/succinylornithine family transaminase [Candidatus Micrarchaeota archaeon]